MIVVYHKALLIATLSVLISHENFKSDHPVRLHDKSSNHWMYGEKPIYILYDKEHYTFCDKGVSDGVSLNVVRDKAGNIEKLVSVDKGELEQFVK